MLADRIKAAVKEKGWTLRELKRRSGVPYDTIYNVVHGRRQDLRFSVVAKIAHTLGLSLDTLADANRSTTTSANGDTPSVKGRRRPAPRPGAA